MRKEIVGMIVWWIVWCAIIVFFLVAEIELAVFAAERGDVGTSDNSLESNSVDGDSDSGDVRGRLECTEEFSPVAVITDKGLTVLVGADGKPVIAEETPMALSNQTAGES